MHTSIRKHASYPKRERLLIFIIFALVGVPESGSITGQGAPHMLWSAHKPNK
jgi:hypothetical protein